MLSLSRLNFTFFLFLCIVLCFQCSCCFGFSVSRKYFQSYEVLTIVICILFLHSSSLLLIINKSPIDELIVCSLNVRGLSNNLKRRETFCWLRMKKFGIFFLQEVHCTNEKEQLWSSEWGFSAIFSSVSSSSAGVCILFNNNFQFEIKKQFSDPGGRFILVDLKLENKTITLGNIYAPNDDNPNFFKNVLSHLLPFECEDIILGGDFNLVLDVQNDKKG